jgi:hypothetical protein
VLNSYSMNRGLSYIANIKLCHIAKEIKNE